MDISRAHCCCFSGHRPEKLNLPEAKLRELLRHEIETAISDGYDTFISGMARGIDVYAAEEVIAAKQAHPHLRLICAFPYSGSCGGFSRVWRMRCESISLHADLRVDICPEYRPDCYHKRNRWMVDRSSRLIAVFNGTAGGTRSTVLYAAAHDVDVRVIMLDT